MSLSQHNRRGTTSSNHNESPIGPESAVPKAAASATAEFTGAIRQGDRALLEAERMTRQLARSHYENFLVGSILLPRRLRQPFYNLYAFCRTADDLADESESTEVATAKLAEFQDRLDQAFSGRPTDPLFVALHSTVVRFSLPRQPFDDLLDAFRQDQAKSRYRDQNELLDYCRRSANPVGRLVLGLIGDVSPQQMELSDRICTGLQLVNFWQDVARDYAIGRIYLPQQAMQEHGVDETSLGQRSTSSALRSCLHEQCDEAERYLQSGLPLADLVPKWFSIEVRLFAAGGLETVRAIRRIDYDVLKTRPTVSKWKQAKLVGHAVLQRLANASVGRAAKIKRHDN